MRHELERVDAKVCLHAGPKEVTRSNRVNEAQGLQVGSRQEGAVDRLSHARPRDASACSNDLLDGLVGGLDEVFERLVELGRHVAAGEVLKGGLVVANVGDKHLDAELVEEVFDVQRLGAHAGQQDAGSIGHLDAIRHGEQQQVDEVRVLDEGVNPLPRGLELLQGLHQLPHFGEAELGRLALEVERRNVLVRRSLPDQVEQTLEV